jgi:hypothetical protein
MNDDGGSVSIIHKGERRGTEKSKLLGQRSLRRPGLRRGIISKL